MINFKNISSIILSLLFLNILYSQDTLKLTYYNILNFPSQQQDRVDTLRKIIDFIQPDIFVVNELTSFNGAMLIKNNALNVNGLDRYSNALFYDGPDTDNLLYYDKDKFGLYSQNQISTTLRDISEYVLFHKSENLNSFSDTTFIYFYSLHLKAGNSSESEERRNQDAVIFKQYLLENEIRKNIFVGGDFNFYDDSELACQEIQFGQNIDLIDPIDKMGNWHSNIAYNDCHTQSTRLSSGGYAGGANGGMDDRFDFIFISEDLISGQNGVKYLNDSYLAEGQDGSYFNQELNLFSNNAVSQDVASALFHMSDHLPVSLLFTVDNSLTSAEMRVENKIFYNSHLKSLVVDDISEIQYLNISDINGKSVFKKSHFIKDFKTIDLSMLKFGFYILNCKTKYSTIAIKIIIN